MLAVASVACSVPFFTFYLILASWSVLYLLLWLSRMHLAKTHTQTQYATHTTANVSVSDFSLGRIEAIVALILHWKCTAWILTFILSLSLCSIHEIGRCLWYSLQGPRLEKSWQNCCTEKVSIVFCWMIMPTCSATAVAAHNHSENGIRSFENRWHPIWLYLRRQWRRRQRPTCVSRYNIFVARIYILRVLARAFDK